MNKDQIFKFQENEVEVIMTDDNQPLFNAANVGVCLGISNIRKNLIALDDDEVIKLTNGGPHFNVTNTDIRKFHNTGENFLTEAGLYSVILTSRKPEAKAFKRWVTHEVLPDIRKHGMYATPMTVDQMLEDPDKMIAVLTKYKEEREARIKAEKEKALIGSKREATAMATAAKYKKKAESAEKKLGVNKERATILGVALKLGVSEKKFNYYKLKKASHEIGCSIFKVPDPRFVTANAYHRDAWKKAYNIDLEKLFA